MAGITTKSGVAPHVRWKLVINLVETPPQRRAVLDLLAGTAVTSRDGAVEVSVGPDRDGDGWLFWLRDPQAQTRVQIGVRPLSDAELAALDGRDVRSPHPAPDRWRQGDEAWELFNCRIGSVSFA